MPTLSLIQNIAVWAIPVLLAITLHEAAHAWVANRCGDPTAKVLGRLSINPLRHIDLIGTIIVPIVVGVLSQFQFIFGWAKPVPINWRLLHKPRRDTALVACAGPLSNFIMAFLWAACFKIASMLHPESSHIALFMLLSGQAGVIINLVLAFLNLIPIPPLDGSRIIASIIPPRQAVQYLKLEPFGFFILIALLFSGVLSWLFGPLLSWSLYFIKVLFNL
jgi:Zn-dependent protease